MEELLARIIIEVVMLATGMAITELLRWLSRRPTTAS